MASNEILSIQTPQTMHTTKEILWFSYRPTHSKEKHMKMMPIVGIKTIRHKRLKFDASALIVL